MLASIDYRATNYSQYIFIQYLSAVDYAFSLDSTDALTDVLRNLILKLWKPVIAKLNDIMNETVEPWSLTLDSKKKNNCVRYYLK